MKWINRKAIFFIILLILGFGYRFFLATTTVTDAGGDMYMYNHDALELLKGKLVAETFFKNMGYGSFLAIIYAIFGVNNLLAVRVVQICLDLVTSLLVYAIAKRLFSFNTAFNAFIIYLSNPLISIFTGLRQTESLTSFIVTLIAYVMSGSDFKTNKWLWFMMGFWLGILLFLRQQYLMLSFAMIILTGLFMIRKPIKLTFIFIAFAGFFLASSYTLLANYVNFKVIKLTPPLANTWTNSVYATFFLDFRWPELSEQTATTPYNMDYVNQDILFQNTPDDQKLALDRKYRDLFFVKMKTDWPIFLNNYLHNIVWLWDKYHLSEYTDVFYPRDVIPIHVYNGILLILYAVGVIGYLVKKGLMSTFKNPVLFFTALFFLYTTFVIPFASNESRHTLPFYSILMMWAGYGFSLVVKMFNHGKKITNSQDNIAESNSPSA
jgi:4-amino-4-deoxy-L-arabinose transferase-like glycosyltransferase